MMMKAVKIEIEKLEIQTCEEMTRRVMLRLLQAYGPHDDLWAQESHDYNSSIQLATFSLLIYCGGSEAEAALYRSNVRLHSKYCIQINVAS
jgi:hypothetical protein